MKKSLLWIIPLIVLLSGCVNIDTNINYRRNGLMNINITFSADDSEYAEGISQGLKNVIVNPELTNQVYYYNTSDSFTYSFINVKPTNTLLISNDSNIGMSPFINESGFSVSEEFIFPYYVYNCTIIFENDEDLSQINDLNMSIGEFYNAVYDVSYAVNVFGTITATNGDLTSTTGAHYNFDYTNPENFYVTLRDFFLFTWLGKLGLM